MVGPVVDDRSLTLQRRQASAEKIAEALPGGIDVATVAIDKVHRHVEHVIDIALEAEAILEDKIKQAGTIRIGIGPDLRAKALETVGLAVGEG